MQAKDHNSPRHYKTSEHLTHCFQGLKLFQASLSFGFSASYLSTLADSLCNQVLEFRSEIIIAHQFLKNATGSIGKWLLRILALEEIK
jgi:hypothetical protein